jgi:hypothetical protein
MLRKAARLSETYFWRKGYPEISRKSQIRGVIDLASEEGDEKIKISFCRLW